MCINVGFGTLYADMSVRASHGEQSKSEASALSEAVALVSAQGCLLS